MLPLLLGPWLVLNLHLYLLHAGILLILLLLGVRAHLGGHDLGRALDSDIVTEAFGPVLLVQFGTCGLISVLHLEVYLPNFLHFDLFFFDIAPPTWGNLTDCGVLEEVINVLLARVGLESGAGSLLFNRPNRVIVALIHRPTDNALFHLLSGGRFFGGWLFRGDRFGGLEVNYPLNHV